MKIEEYLVYFISIKNYLLNVNYKNTRKRCEICSGVFIENFEHISHLFLVFLLLTLSKQLFAGIDIPKSESSSRDGTEAAVRMYSMKVYRKMILRTVVCDRVILL